MRENTNKNYLPVHFSKAKLTFYPFATIYYSNVLTCLQICLHLLKFSDKFDPKCQQAENLPENLNNLRAAGDACDI